MTEKMTLANWNASPSPCYLIDEMASLIQPEILRKYGLKCCEAVVPTTDVPELKEAMQLAENYLQGNASDAELLALSSRIKQECRALTRKPKEKKDDHIRFWSLWAAMHLLQTDFAFKNEEGDGDLTRVYDAVCSLASAHYFEKSERVQLRHHDETHDKLTALFREMIPYPHQNTPAPTPPAASKKCDDSFLSKLFARKKTKFIPSVTDYEHLRRQTAASVRQAAEELRRKFNGDRLFSFALCTDDDVNGVFNAACTVSWVREKEEKYRDIGFIYVDWEQSADAQLFDPVCDQLGRLAESESDSDDELDAARNKRFNALVLALLDCRQGGVFDDDTLLLVGSTDPSKELQALAMRGVDALNKKDMADKFSKASGYEKYRLRQE